MKHLILWALTAYKKYISPLFPPSCRYEPSCSRYMHDAICRFGIIRGSWLGVRRLSRCHPFAGSGYDPVPQDLESSK